MSLSPPHVYTASDRKTVLYADGEVVQVIEEDDGSGWVKVLNEHGQSGLVPATYLEEEKAAPVSMPVPARSPVSRAQGSGEKGKSPFYGGSCRRVNALDCSPSHIPVRITGYGRTFFARR